MLALVSLARTLGEVRETTPPVYLHLPRLYAPASLVGEADSNLRNCWSSLALYLESLDRLPLDLLLLVYHGAYYLRDSDGKRAARRAGVQSAWGLVCGAPGWQMGRF